MNYNKNYQEELSKYLPNWIMEAIKKLSKVDKENLMEIRVRINSPVSFILKDKVYFLTVHNNLSNSFNENMQKTTNVELENIFNSMCNYSIYSYLNEIINGFITLEGGHRVGISGKYLSDVNTTYSIKDITSLNIRIAREVIGCSNNLCKKLFSNQIEGVLITAPPRFGKTTLLRDIARNLSSGRLGKYFNVVIIDERGEISGLNSTGYKFDIGTCTDVVTGCSKDKGIERAVRTLSPDVIICDEAGNENEIKAISQGLNSGCTFITTAHCSSIDDLYNRAQIRCLLLTGAIKYIVMLNSLEKNENIESIKGVYLIASDNGCYNDFSLCDVDWNRQDNSTTKTSEIIANNNNNAYISF